MTTLDQPIGQLALDIPGATALFHTHRLDFCCGGKRTLRQAAEARRLNPDAIASELEQLSQRSATSAANIDELSDIALIEHILTRYHDVHRQQLPELIRLAARVEQVHGGHAQCPAGLTHLLENLQRELEEHMRKEEQILFPMLTRGMKRAAVHPVAVMRAEHDDHGVLLDGLLALTRGLELPAGACNTWQALYRGLDVFRRDLMEHIHLENNLLFDRIDGQLEAVSHG